MVKVKLKQKNPENLDEWIEKEIYLDDYLKSNLDLGISQLKKDWDQVWFIDGKEGDGKSVLAMTLAYYVNPEESRHTLLDRIIVNIDEADKVLLSSQPFEAVVIDESFGGMSASGSMSKINRLLQRRFTEIRAKNLFVFILAPSFMDIQRYFAIWRSKALIHVYTKDESRGYAAFFNANTKKKLYILGKKQFYEYGVVPANFLFRFTKETEVVDYAAYKKKKSERNLTIGFDVNELKFKREVWKEVIEKAKSCPKPLTSSQLRWITEYCMRRIQQITRDLGENEVKSADYNTNLIEKDDYQGEKDEEK